MRKDLSTIKIVSIFILVVLPFIFSAVKAQTTDLSALDIQITGNQASISQNLNSLEVNSSGFSITAFLQAPGDVTFLGMDYQTTLIILGILAALLLAIVIVLFLVKDQLNALLIKREQPDQETPESGLTKLYRSTGRAFYPVKDFVVDKLNPTIGVLTVIGILVIYLAFDMYNRAQDLGTQVGYAPEQPVKYSHKLHAGQYNIDCQYCHTGVQESKSATIPSTNVCMNCHNYIQEGPKYGSKEIKKVVESYENNEPIDWVRIHNLPDHVYFNHAQHVNVGNLECQECHGQVQNMEVVHQHAKLEMGWCINCHREKNIDASNEYYQKTFDFIEEHDKYTVSDMGGTECQKCHY